MKTTTRVRGVQHPFLLRLVDALRIRSRPIASKLRVLSRNLGRLHAACVCQRRDGRLLCGLAVSGFISLS